MLPCAAVSRCVSGAAWWALDWAPLVRVLIGDVTDDTEALCDVFFAGWGGVGGGTWS